MFKMSRSKLFDPLEEEKLDGLTCSGNLITAPVNLCNSLTFCPPFPIILPTLNIKNNEGFKLDKTVEPVQKTP